MNSFLQKWHLVILFLNCICFLTAQRQPAKVTTVVASTVATVIGAESVQCTAADCNDRGTCVGLKSAPICFCQLGVTGSRCEDTYCDPIHNCSNHGWCMGTSSKFVCVCNFGYEGINCEKEAKMPIITLKPIDFGLTTKANQIEETKTTLKPNNLENIHFSNLRNQEINNEFESLNKLSNEFDEENGEAVTRNFHKFNRRK